MSHRKDEEITDYTCFDLETTGFGNSAEIIEIGAVKVRNNEIVDEFNELIKPLNSIPYAITLLTGITQEDVENCRGISEVLPEFLDFIGDDILVGHNIASFDIPQIRRAVSAELKRDFSVKYIDTVYMSKSIQDLDNHKLQTMLDYYGIQNERAHRAFQDCEATTKLLKSLVADGIPLQVRYSCNSPVSESKEISPKEHMNVCFSEKQITALCGKNIVITGDFEYGSREEVEEALIAAGATIKSTVSRKTDFLIVGCYGSGNWKFDNGGIKIQEAQKRGIEIIRETDIQILNPKTEVQND